MAFDVDSWKATVRERLQDWRPRMADLGANAVYGFLAATALSPLIEAAQGGQLFPALVAAGSVAGSVGGNLLAEQVQRWQDRANEAGAQGELTTFLAREAESQAALRDALDQMLEAFEVIPQAQQGLSPSDREWFATTLRAELNRLGNLPRFETILTEGGASVEGPVHVDRGDFVGHDKTVHGDEVRGFKGGDHSRFVSATNYFENPRIVQGPAEAEAARAEEHYLLRLEQRCNVLPLAALGGEEGVGEDITLDQVYVALDTRTRVPLTEAEKAEREKARPYSREADRALSALEAATQSRRLVLLGDPGSGKSSFVRQLVAELVRARRGLRPQLEGWDPSWVPVFLVLRDLAPRLADLAVDHLPADQRDRALLGAVREQWRAMLADHGAPGFIDRLETFLIHGQVVLIFDGLDEVTSSLRLRVRQAVQAILRDYSKVARVFVTSRIRSYTGGAVLPGFDVHTLAPFDGEKIEQFVRAWYRAQTALGRISADRAKQRADDLTEAAQGQDLHELASNPMLLTTMAIIHQREVGLPRERVRLYSLAVQVLLSRWQQHKGAAVSERLAAFLRDDLKLRTILERLAYEAHQGQAARGEAADLQRGELLMLLENPAYLVPIRITGQRAR